MKLINTRQRCDTSDWWQTRCSPSRKARWEVGPVGHVKCMTAILDIYTFVQILDCMRHSGFCVDDLRDMGQVSYNPVLLTSAN